MENNISKNWLFLFIAIYLGFSLKAQSDSTTHYPINERQDDFLNNQSDNPFDFEDPSAVVKDVVYDPNTDTYIITEKVNGVDIKSPTYMTFDEYVKYTTSREMDDYWKQKSTTKDLIENSTTIIPPINVNKQFFNRIFGSNSIDIKPQGNVEVTLGGQSQFYDNPNIPIRSRSNPILLFDMGINMSLTGKIGEKLQVTLKYNNSTGFSFDNKFKLQYTGEEDDIIQLLEAGSVSMPLETQLISGAQSLNGFKSVLKFGHLTVTSVFSEQESKKESIIIEDGAQTQKFEIKADQYEADKHFFLSQYFEKQYDQALSEQPNILSLITIEEIEVWITNRSNNSTNVRDIVALMDLGENEPYSTHVHAQAGKKLPANDANDLYSKLTSSPYTRLVDNVVTELQGGNFNLNPIQDYEKTYAKLLSVSEYKINKQLGYISLNSALQSNQILGVAFKYTYNGVVYQVGELSRNVPPDSISTSKALFVKMLRSTSQRPELPIWDLMMKNIYSLGAFQISPEDFRLDIFYKDPGGGEKRFLPADSKLSNKQIISVLSLDNLNKQGDPQPDGLFDFQADITIKPSNGKLIFPVTKPFGDYLEKQLTDAGANQTVIDKYVFSELYDSSFYLAQQLPEKNRYVIRGRYQSKSSNVIRLNAYQLPENSVTVSLGGLKLVEGVDYTVDYSGGTVTIINEALLNSGQQIKVDFENQSLFAFQKQSFIGTRLDYRFSEKFHVGGTVINMAERPYSQKINIGEDPINNTILGLDFKYGSDLPFLTKVLDALPLYETKEMSSFTVQGEVAHLIPGHNALIGTRDSATAYLDDFEGSSSSIDLKGSSQTWSLASTPNGATDKAGNILFPEASFNKDLRTGMNRAKISWYNIDPTFFENRGQSPQEVFDNKDEKSNHYVRKIYKKELFPNIEEERPEQVFTLDLAYFPEEKGPYNFEVVTPSPNISRGLRPDGRLINPESRWGGISRGIETNNFENSNVEYIEFWMLDPFIYDDNATGGQIHFNLGTISEDILKDSKMLYEHGLSSEAALIDSTKWGIVPKSQPITNSFSNDNNLRPIQDVGFDGLTDVGETLHFANYINEINSSNLDAEVKARLIADPSQDNFEHYFSENYSGISSIVQRYKSFNSPQSNSPISSGTTTNAGSSMPNIEDLNRDNSLNENEAFFQYIIDLYPNMSVDNHPFLVSVQEREAFTPYTGGPEIPDYKWYQFRIPVREYQAKIGNIQDFSSIQFMRMFMTGWEKPTVIRFGTLDLIRNQWRTYNFDLSSASDRIPTDEDGTFFNVSQVNFEENNTKEPVNYILPPSIKRELGLSSNTTDVIKQNEQSLSASVCGLKDGDSRAIYKTLKYDFRNYKRVKLDIHANRLAGEELPEDGSLTAFIRFGLDFKDNYYEYEVPLNFTPDKIDYDNDISADQLLVWPKENRIDLRIEDLIAAKKERNLLKKSLNSPYKFKTSDGRYITIKGIPDVGAVEVLMLGVRNPNIGNEFNPLASDDGLAKCAEIWFNELRLSGFDEEGGTAALASISLKLADLGNLNFSTSMHTIGFGQVDMKLDKRYQEENLQYSFNGNLELGKFLPKKAKVRLPFFASISQNFTTPEYDPYQLDVKSKDMLETLSGDTLKNYEKTIQTIHTRRGFNFTNVRKLPGEKAKVILPISPSNFALTYAYTEEEFSDPFTESDIKQNHLARIDYNYSLKPKYLYPFKKMIKSRSKWFTIVKDININFFPSTMSINTQMDRQFAELKLRQLQGETFTLPSTFDKFFNWNRTYTFKYNPFKSLALNYGASNNSKIDEAIGLIDTKEEKDEIFNNIKKGGRNTNFSQNFSASYTLPLNKIPLLAFTSTKLNYSSAYNWIAAPLRKSESGNLVTNSLGNIMNNNQELRMNSSFNMKKLYSMSPYLKKFNNIRSSTKESKIKKRASIKKAKAKIDKEIDKLKVKIKKEKDKLKLIKVNKETKKETQLKQIASSKKRLKNYKKQLKRRKQNKAKKQTPVTTIESILVQPLLMLKKVTLNYSENRATTLPGYTPNTRFFGVDDLQKEAPGWDFVFGSQPGFRLFEGFDENKRDAWLDNAAQQNWISSDTLLNQKFNQTFSRNLGLKATLEPFTGLKIDLNLDQNKTINHSQFFKKTDEDTDWEHLLPKEMGSYSISTITLNTMFRAYDEQWLNETYRTFESNRSVISRRLQELDPTSIGNYFNPSDTISPENPNYAAGYGPTSQDVLIPSFLAAYQDIDASKVGLDALKMIPLPNWKVTYNGLTKMKWAKKIFTSFTIRSGYKSKLQVNSFQTNLDNSVSKTNNTGIDSINGNNFSRYNIPTLMINEQLSPLIGVDMTFKNGLTARFDYKKSRTMAVNFTDYQLIENNSETITVGLAYRIKGLILPFKLKKKRIILHNELNMRFDFSIRDNVIVNHKLDQGISIPSSGSQNITISPSIDYVINKQFNIKIFYDFSSNTPKTANTFPSSNTRAGITLRFSLADF